MPNDKLFARRHRVISNKIERIPLLVQNRRMSNQDDDNFADLIKGVTPLKNDRVNLHGQTSRKTILPAKQAARGDLDPGNDFSARETRESQFNPGLQKKVQRKIRQGVLRPEASLDLHGFRQQEAQIQLEAFFAQARSKGLKMTVVIHGQGYRSEQDPVLKPMVFRWLAAQSFIMAWCPAQPRDGAAGASYVYLRSNADADTD